MTKSEKTLWTRLKTEMVGSYQNDDSVAVYEQLTNHWQLCCWVKAKKLFLSTSDDGCIRVCINYQSLGLGGFPRSPTAFKDYFPFRTVTKATLALKGYGGSSSLLTSRRALDMKTLERDGEQTCEQYVAGMADSESECVSVDLWFFNSVQYDQTCKLFVSMIYYLFLMLVSLMKVLELTDRCYLCDEL